jgi:hypothetical protein
MPAKKQNSKPTPDKSRNPELRIYGVAEVVHDSLINISDNIGISFSDFMKPHLRKIMEEYPEHMKKPKPKD